MSKDTTVVVTAVSKATKGLTTQVTSLAKLVGELQVLQSMVPELADEISMKSAELAQIDADTKEAVRKAKAELNLQILENEDKVLVTLLAKQKKANISLADLDDLQERLVFAENDSSARVADAVSAKQKELTTAYEYQVKDIEGQHKIETASLSAELAQLRKQVQYLEEAKNGLEQTLSEERKARIETAKYSQPIINTTGSAGRQ